MQVVGQIGGAVQAVAVKGSYAYVGVGSRLVALDVSNPRAPRELGASEPMAGPVRDVSLVGHFAYVAAAGGGLYALDISDPAEPLIVGVYDTPGYAEGVVVSGDIAYVADGPGGLRVVGVADPARPAEVGSAYPLSYILDVALAGRHAYLAAGGTGLLTVDVTDPALPAEIGRRDTPGFAYGIGVSGDVAYVADGWKGVRIVDVSDPARPTAAGSFDTPGWAMYVVVRRDIVYVADAFGGMRLLDGSDPTRLEELGSYQQGISRDDLGHAESVEISGTLAFVADRNHGLLAVDVSEATQPRKVSLYRPMGLVDGVAVSGDLAVVAAGRYGVRLINVSKPRRPREIGALRTRARTAVVTLFRSFAYVTTYGHDLYVVDVSDPTRPTASLFMTPGRVGSSTPRNQFVAGSTLYVAAESTLFALDISHPRAPCKWFAISSAGASGIAVSGSVAYVADGHAGLLVLDVSDPRNPEELGRYQDTPISAEDVLVSGSIAFLLAHDHVRVLDVSDPGRPTVLGFYALPTGVQGWGPFMAVEGNILYVADGTGGLVALDVSDPAVPRLAAHMLLPGIASAVTADGRYVYVAAEGGGLFVLEPISGSGSPGAPRTAEAGAWELTRRGSSRPPPVPSMEDGPFSHPGWVALGLRGVRSPRPGFGGCNLHRHQPQEPRSGDAPPVPERGRDR